MTKSLVILVLPESQYAHYWENRGKNVKHVVVGNKVLPIAPQAMSQYANNCIDIEARFFHSALYILFNFLCECNCIIIICCGASVIPQFHSGSAYFKILLIDPKCTALHHYFIVEA